MNIYDEAPTVKVNWTKYYAEGHNENPFQLFDNAEYQFSGDFLIIYQQLKKTVIPLFQVDSVEVPYVKV